MKLSNETVQKELLSAWMLAAIENISTGTLSSPFPAEPRFEQDYLSILLRPSARERLTQFIRTY